MGQRLIQFVVDKYGLEYYWWYWPAVILIGIVSAVLWFKLNARQDRLAREHAERFPEPPDRQNWL
jgi:hypothetical protein